MNTEQITPHYEAVLPIIKQNSEDILQVKEDVIMDRPLMQWEQIILFNLLDAKYSELKKTIMEIEAYINED